MKTQILILRLDDHQVKEALKKEKTKDNSNVQKMSIQLEDMQKQINEQNKLIQQIYNSNGHSGTANSQNNSIAQQQFSFKQSMNDMKIKRQNSPSNGNDSVIIEEELD